jgi:hypothetical protein
MTSYKKKKKEKTYTCKIKISVKKRKDIEVCAKAKGITLNRFIKDAINQSILEFKVTPIEDNSILRNQLKLFDTEDYFKNDEQLNLDL